VQSGRRSTPTQQRQAHTHGGPATSSAHARLPCDPDVVRATSSDHGSPACDPTVAGNPPAHTNHFHTLRDGHGRTTSSQIVTAARRQRATAARIQLSHTAASTTPEHSRKDPAAVHRCLDNTETTPEHSQKDPAAVHRCLDGAEAAVSRSRMRVATKRGGGETGTSHIGQQDQHWCWPEVPGQIPAPHQAP
jgi:hypothetical protein